MTYAELDARDVLKACDLYFERHKRRIDGDRESFIETYTKPRSGLLARIFGKGMTREEASHLWETEHAWISEITGGLEAQRMKNVRELARFAATQRIPVNVSSDDFISLRTHLWSLHS
jgi:hypothetical protein